ncbi:hypothetical protein Q7C18_09745 [Nesterenkonia sp. CL21]|uniref:AMIN-like domain-containing (lipo)protein n=1 Tax=Nesterenkonia sp. CL21 TaxID=3064894 RepID=UPI002879D09B|nr:hypothetical protein [Nesterenkonia sp. CL21]MDS2172980.1 hypothetical protein [Nesterenkonia sp. CL21]
MVPRGPDARRTPWHDRPAALLGAGLVALSLAACGPGDETPDEDPDSVVEEETDPDEAPTDDDADPDDPDPDDTADDVPEPEEVEAPDAAESPDAEAPEAEFREHREGLSEDRFDTEPRESAGFPDALVPPPEDEDLLLCEVRLGAHDGYDRVVFDHAGTGFPGWRTEYVDEPTQPGSGHLIEMDGDAYLAVHVTGLWPGNAGEDQGHLVMETDWAHLDTLVEGTATTIVFEGAASYYISLDQVRDYDVFAIEDGSRLVIDILH